MTKYGGNGSIVTSFLTSELDGGESLASRPGRYTPGEGAPSTISRGSWVDPRAGLDTINAKKIRAPARNRTPAFRPVVRCYTYLGLLT
jgi:hypothetical protein